MLGKDLASDIGAKVGDTVRAADAERHAVADGRDAAAAALEGRRAVPHGPLRGRRGLRASSISTPACCWPAPIASITSRSKVADVYDAPRIADQIAEQFGQDYVTQDWTDINQQLYSALLLEKIGMGIGIGLIVAVAALNIVASLILLVMEKTRDIAILKTMGASARSIMLIFLLQGTIIGVIGTIIGATAGAVTAYFLDRYRVITIPERRLPGQLSAVQAAARRFRRGGDRRRAGVLRSPRCIPRARRRGSIRRRRCGTSSAMAFVSVTGLNKFYDVAGKRLHVLRDLDLSVEKGEMVAIMGASGVGKSTLLHVLGGLDVIDGGQVRVGDHEIATMNDEARVAFRNRHIGFVFQFHHLLPEFTAIENAMMPMRIARVSRPPRRGRRPRRCCSASGSAIGSIIGRACCRAASSSAWRCRARS